MPLISDELLGIPVPLLSLSTVAEHWGDCSSVLGISGILSGRMRSTELLSPAARECGEVRIIWVLLGGDLVVVSVMLGLIVGKLDVVSLVVLLDVSLAASA